MEWKTQKLGDVCEIIKRGVAPKYIEEGGICVINQKCVRDHAINYTLARRHNLEIKKINEERYIQIGDVLVNSTGTGTLGRVAQIREIPVEPTTVDTHVTIVRPKKELFYNDFFGYMLIKIEEEITSAGEGASGQTELARAKLENEFFVSYPASIQEQKRIVALLDTVFADLEQTRRKTEQNLKNARELFESYLQQVFSQKGEGWEDKTLSDVVLFENGDRGKNYPSRSKFVESGIAFINAGHIHNGKVDLSKMNYISKETYDLLGRGKVKGGDILFCLRGSLGKFALIRSDLSGAIASSLVIMRPKKDLSTEFLLHYLRGGLCKNMIEKYAGGAAQPNLGAKDLAKFTISVPEFNVQKTVANKLDILIANVERLEANYQRKLLSIDELKKSILQKAFSGELTKG